MEENEKKAGGENNNNERQEIFSQTIRAGKRTYFFDVKSTRNNDYYLTITESKKRFNKEGKQYFEKHKIFLYKEDFEKFNGGFTEVVSFINNAQPLENKNEENKSEGLNDGFTDVNFDDLEKKDDQ